MRQVGKLPPTDIPILWGQVVEVLRDKSIGVFDKITEEELLAAIYTGFCDLWLGMNDGVVEGAVICQWENWSKVKYYNIVTIAGKGLKYYLREGLDKIEKYASLGGASEVRIEGRRGWTRILNEYSVRPYVLLKKDVKVLWKN